MYEENSSKKSIKEKVSTCKSFLFSSKMSEIIPREKIDEAHFICCKEIDLAASDVEIKVALDKFIKAFVTFV